MKSKKTFRIFNLCLILIVGVGCEYKDYPDPVWDENDAGTLAPVISQVTPSDYVLTGTGDMVTITGSNFSDIAAGNVVFFGSHLAEVISGTATEIVVMPPVITASGVTLKVGSQGAYAFGEYAIPYELEKVAIDYHAFKETSQLPLSLDLDPDENLYVLIDDQSVGKIIKLDAFSEEQEIATELSFANYGAMHYAPDHCLLNTKFTAVYKTPIIMDSVIVDPEKYFSGNVKKKNTDFDFDQYGNMYYTGKQYITRLSAADTTSSYVSEWESSIGLLTCKVHDDYVYTSNEDHIYRNQILDASGDLGAIEDVFDFSVIPGVQINSMTLAANGDIFVGCDSLAGNDGNVFPIYKIANNNGDWSNSTPEPLYATALSFPVSDIVWGESNYLYFISNEKVIRVNMRVEGSTYHGREL